MARKSFSRQSTVRHHSWEGDVPRRRRQDVVLDISSSTEDDPCSFSSDDDHVIYSVDSAFNADHMYMHDSESLSILGRQPIDLDDENDDDDDDDHLDEAEKGEVGEAELNSQDWEVQMLARQLVEEQRGVARKIDKDIAAGKFKSPLAELHEALATDNISSLTDCDLVRLEKIVRRERENLRKFAKLYSLDERPVLEDQFSRLYRSRSQLLVSRSSELCQAGPTQKRLSCLLDQLTTLSPAEQFLLDRLVYKKARNRRLMRQRSLCDDQLSTFNDSRLPQTLCIGNTAESTFRRSVSMCSPPPSNLSPRFTYRSSPESSSPRQLSGRGRIFNYGEGEEQGLVGEQGPTGEIGPPTVSAMLESVQRSVSTMSDSSRDKDSAKDTKPSYHEAQPLLRPPR